MQLWLSEQDPGELAISDWVVTEFSAALSIKLRTGQIESRHRADAHALFNRLTEESFGLLPITGAHFRTAARLADRHETGLRAGDALHLAIAFDHGATLCTLDRPLAAAGQELGVRTDLL